MGGEDIMINSNILSIDRVGKHTGTKNGKRVGNPRSYKIHYLTEKEIAYAKSIKLELIEKGTLEKTEAGDADEFPTGLFLFHHPRYLPRINGMTQGLRCEGGEIINRNGKRRYPPPIQKEGQQTTTCSACGKDVLLHIDFRPGDILKQNGAYCLDCVIGHKEHHIPFVLVDEGLKFKTSGRMYITNQGVMRTYAGEAWRAIYDLGSGDSISFYRVIEDDSGIFIGTIFVKAIRQEKANIEKSWLG